jgi:hypothetical protein
MTRLQAELRSADSGLYCMDLGINPGVFEMSFLT